MAYQKKERENALKQHINTKNKSMTLLEKVDAARIELQELHPGFILSMNEDQETGEMSMSVYWPEEKSWQQFTTTKILDMVLERARGGGR